MPRFKEFGKIFISLAISFIIVIFYGQISSKPFITPTEASNIKNLLSKLKFNPIV